jgi:hypothetical protein
VTGLQDTVKLLIKNISSHLKKNHHLVLMDDIWEADSYVLNNLIVQGGHSSLVVTSRHNFGVDLRQLGLEIVHFVKATLEDSRNMVVSYAYCDPRKTFGAVSEEVQVCSPLHLQVACGPVSTASVDMHVGMRHRLWPVAVCKRQWHGSVSHCGSQQRNCLSVWDSKDQSM